MDGKLKVLVHEAEEGGYWAEVPAIPGCITEGDDWEQLLANGCLSVDVEVPADQKTKVLNIAV